MTTKEAQDQKFNWINPKRITNTSDMDVSITFIKGDIFAFVFRNNTWEFFDGRVEFAIYKNRILFRHSDVGMQIKPKKGSKTPNHYGKISGKCTPKGLRNFIGDYIMKYDEFYELYYIEKEEKDETGNN